MNVKLEVGLRFQKLLLGTWCTLGRPTQLPFNKLKKLLHTGNCRYLTHYQWAQRPAIQVSRGDT
jgi:hypothetical protein